MTARKSAIVTGAGSGIGRAAAERLVRSGYNVTLAEIHEARGRETEAALRRLGDAGVHFVKTDVSNEHSVQMLVEAAVSSFGRLDAAINCAGVPQAGKPVHHLSAEEWDHCTGINLRGMFLCLKYEIAAMLNNGGGSVVAVSSAAASKGLINSTEYCASKSGITGLVRAAALDCATSGVRVNALLPGGTDTPLARRSMEANPKLAESVIIPMGRMARPDEIAAGALWLVSDESSYVTGACISIDGGMTIV